MPSRYNPDQHHRRSIRLQGYDYTAAGAYFVTVCAYQRECLFGAIEGGEMRLSQFGQTVADTYGWIAIQYPYVYLDEWIVMPNHLHGILVIIDNRRGDSRIALTPHSTTRKPLGRLVGAFKTVSTKQINLIRETPETPVWQCNYYEHIIRDDRALQQIRHYIQNNPTNWQQDQLHPNHPQNP